jgi:3D (Asp-Asp-Asp) domain-containing protein
MTANMLGIRGSEEPPPCERTPPDPARCSGGLTDRVAVSIGRKLRSGWTPVAVCTLLIVSGGCAGRIPPNTTPVPPPQSGSSSRPSTHQLAFVATAYCQGTITAAATAVTEGIVAADPAVLPLGTVIRVDGAPAPYNRVYRVMDTGRRIQGHRIDVYIRDCAAAVQFGRRPVQLSLVTRRAASSP